MKLENNIFVIEWKRGAGKTLTASTLFAPNYQNILVNYELIIPKKNIIKYKNIDIFKYLSFSDLSKKLIIFDEWGINASNRESMSKRNKILSFFVMVSRKFNADLLVILQDFEDVDKKIRKQTDYKIEIKKIWEKQLLNIWQMDFWKEKFLNSFEFDGLTAMKKLNIYYDTRDLSGFKERLEELLRDFEF